jgi:hypothetical protein
MTEKSLQIKHLLLGTEFQINNLQESGWFELFVYFPEKESKSVEKGRLVTEDIPLGIITIRKFRGFVPNWDFHRFFFTQYCTS